MTFELRPATDEDVRGFAAWRYDAPFDVYNIAMGPDEAVAYFLGPDVHCHTLVHGDDVVGYCTFGHDARVPGGDYDEVLHTLEKDSSAESRASGHRRPSEAEITLLQRFGKVHRDSQA
jgi:hypothetical protein